MNRAIGKVALILAVVALSGCGGVSPTDEEPTVETAAEETSEAEEAPEGDDEPMEIPPPTQYPLDNVTGQDDYGTVYNMSSVQSFPEDVTRTIDEAGIEFEEGVTLEGLRMVCVEIDNTYGSQEATLRNLIFVTPDGVQHEFRTMDDYLFEMAEGMDVQANYEGYSALFELSGEWDEKRRVAPTATSNACFPFDPALEGGEFTYIAATGGPMDVPLYPVE